MKKKLFGLMVLVLLLVAVGTAQAAAPNTVEKYCSVCKTDRTFIRTGFACITGSEHNSIYNCTTCADEAIWTEYREAHLIIPATCTENQKCAYCNLEDYAWQYNGYATGHDWSEWTFNGGGTHTRTCTNDATHTQTGNCKSYTWAYDANTHTKTWTCSECPGGADTKIEQTHVYADDTDLTCDLCGYVRTVAHEHTGGTATCTDKAVCEGCGSAYGEVDPDAHDWGGWASNGNGTHTRTCKTNSSHTETGNCYGNDGSCAPACLTCNDFYYDPNGNHRSFDSWVPYSATQHYRACFHCNTTVNSGYYEYADHTGGTATCTEKAKCEVCATAYGDPLGHTPGTAATCTTDQLCTREGCGAVLTEKLGHIPGAEATCTTDQLCTREGCGAVLAEKLGHIPGAAATCTTDQLCTREGCGAVLTEKLGHIPGAAATCTTDQLCTREGCGAVLTEKLGHIPGAAATCTTDQLCTREGCGAVLAEKLGHDWGSWADNGDGTHTRICGNDAAHTETADCTWGPWVKLNEQQHERRCTVCNAQEVEEHTGGTATCSEPCICDVCGDHYGSPDSSGLTGHPNPTIEVLPATCLIDGYYHIICDVPGCSAPFTEIILPAYGQHLYNHWDILGDCAHHTACDLCGEDASVGCTLFGMLDGETLLTVCPVCGDFGETPFEVLIAREDAMVPIGTLLVRGLKAPIPDALWGFTVAGVYGGEVVDIHGMVTITLPVDLTELGGFTVVRVDMVDGEEIRTEIPFTLEDGLLTIQTDTAGLFLLVSAN